MEDYEILDAALSDHGMLQTVYVWHVAEPIAALADRYSLKAALGFADDVPREIAVAVWQAEPARIDTAVLNSLREAAALRRTTDYKLLTEEMLVEATGKVPQPNWLLHPSVLPNAGAICRVTRPVVRPDRRAAYLIYLVSTRWWGASMACRVDKDPLSGRWKTGTCGRHSFTRWKDGKMVFEDVVVSSGCCPSS
jgi:hypothetical protein